MPQHKTRNKLTKIMNGNINSKTLKILQWNMGSKYWVRKFEKVQAIVDTERPDIMYITEANLFKADPDYSLVIENYRLVLPKNLEQSKPGVCQNHSTNKRRFEF